MDFKHLKERRIVQLLLTYAAGGWVALQLVDQVVDRSVLPEVVYRVALTLFLCGIPGALIVSWYHGAKGAQKAPPLEKWLLAGVAVFAIAASTMVARANITPAAAPALELSANEDPRRLAVLYFGAQGGGEDADFLAAGLTESLIDELSQVDSLSVVSRNGSQLFRDLPRPGPDSISKVLSVGTLVDGTVSVAGDRVRVNVTLVDGRDGTQLGSLRLERPREQLFDLQDSLSVQVADFLRREIGVQLGRMVLRQATESREAWELVQQASVTTDRADESLDHGDIHAASIALSQADSTLARAESADPAWVEPVTRRGWLAYRQSRLGGFDRATYDEWIGIGLDHAERALALEPRDPSALELKGTLLYWRYLLGLVPDEAEADEIFHTAEELFRAAGTPSAEASLSHLLSNKGEIQLAYLAALNSYDADPFLENANLILWRLTRAQWDIGDDRQSRRWCEEGARRFPEDFRFQQCQLMLYALPGVQPDVPTAWALAGRFVEMSPPQVQEINQRQALQFMGMALVRASLPDSARNVLVRGRAEPDIDPVRDLALLESIPRSWLGDWSDAIRLMGLYFSANPAALAGYRASIAENVVPWFHRDLAEQPEFQALLGLD